MNILSRIGLTLATSFVLLGAASAQDILVGLAGPITGNEANFGRQMKSGAEQALADINATGGVLGRKLTLGLGDDACEARQARSVANRFVVLKAAVVVGHFCSSSSIPASEAYRDGQVLQITPATTNPKFTDQGFWNTFRVCGRDDQQGAFIAAYIANNYGTKNIAIVHDKTIYGEGLAEAVQQGLVKAGMPPKYLDSFQRGESDFTALATKLKREGIDIVFVGGYHREAGLIVRQMRSQGMKTVLMSGDALADKEFGIITGAGGDGTLFTFGPDPRLTQSAAAIVKRFRDNGIDPEGYTLYTYAAFQVWSQAVAKAKTLKAETVAETIRGGKWNTVLGMISYDKKGDVIDSNWAVYKWDKTGEYAQVAAGARR